MKYVDAVRERKQGAQKAGNCGVLQVVQVRGSLEGGSTFKLTLSGTVSSVTNCRGGHKDLQELDIVRISASSQEHSSEHSWWKRQGRSAITELIQDVDSLQV